MMHANYDSANTCMIKQIMQIMRIMQIMILEEDCDACKRGDLAW